MTQTALWLWSCLAQVPFTSGLFFAESSQEAKTNGLGPAADPAAQGGSVGFPASPHRGQPAWGRPPGLCANPTLPEVWPLQERIWSV